MNKLKLISLLCTIAMLIGCFAMFPAAAADGDTATETESITAWQESDGAGTAGKTYGLNNSNFQKFWEKNKYDSITGTLPNIYGNYVLTEDIVVTTEWDAPLGQLSNSTFDGQGHKISGINMKTAKRAGLFWQIQGGTFSNLKVVDSTFESEYIGDDGNTYIYSGAIAGVLGGGAVMSNCYSNATVIAGANGTSSAGNKVTAGGLVGKAYDNPTINNSVFAGSVTSNGYTGGIF